MILPCHSFVMAEHRGRLLPITLLGIVQRDEAGEAAPAAALQGRIHIASVCTRLLSVPVAKLL